MTSVESKENLDFNKKGEHINRFGEGIDERCKTGLYLPAISYSTVGKQVNKLIFFCMTFKAPKMGLKFPEKFL